MTDLIKFKDLVIEDVASKIEAYISRSLKIIDELCSQDIITWDNFAGPLEILDNDLNNYWSQVSHLNSVVNSEELRKAYNSVLPKLSAYSTEVGQNKTMFAKFKNLYNSPEFDKMTEAQQKSIVNSLRDFRLSGIDLEPKQQQEFKNINLRLSELSSKFSENILDCTNDWSKLITDTEELKGLPAETLAIAKSAAEEDGLTGFKLTLDFPCYLAVMQYSENRSLRYDFYRAFQTRGATSGPHDHKYDNSSIMQELLELRYKKATLLGFDSYSELSLETKMASKTADVFDFLDDLLDRSLPQAKKELEALAEFSKQNGLEKLEPWDLSYYSELMQKNLFGFSAQELKPWFPVDKVLEGLFEITSQLFNFKFEEVLKVDVWHEDVRVFKVLTAAGETKAYFYLDLYARANKRGGAWMDVCRDQVVIESKLQIPIAYLTCNFTPTTKDSSSLLTHDEVVTLFHEFGHGLHHMLSEIDIPSVGGINGVSWDAVELPSQFMENFCWSEETLLLISGHHETGEPLPKDKLSALLGAKNFQSAMAMVRQLEFSLFDFHLHANQPVDTNFVELTLHKIRTKTSIFSLPSWTKFANGFSHIFAGGYSAGYYSYKWAEVLSADAFAAFEETKIVSPVMGNKFLVSILQKGGSQDAMNLFVKFRGREPNIEALLRHSEIGS